MNTFVIVGGIIFVIGIAMTVWYRPLGVKFCRLGKRICESNPIVKDLASLYDESKGPSRIRFLGIVNLIQGLIIMFLGMIL